MLHFNFKATLLVALSPLTLALYLAPQLAAAQASSPSVNAPIGQNTTAATAALSANQPLSILAAYEAAWARQPEAQSLSIRKQAIAAQRNTSNSWSPEPPAIELSTATDRFGGNAGGRGYGVAVSVPLWLAGERNGAKALADAQTRGLDANLNAIKLKTAASVREAYWTWQRGQVELDLANDRLKSAKTIAADVNKRLKAGDLARADQHQADGNVAAAEGSVAESEQAVMSAQQQLKALIGFTPSMGSTTAIDHLVEALPAASASIELSSDQMHPELIALNVQADIAKQAAQLAATQNRANSEVTVGLNRERGAFGDTYQSKLNIGMRIPFGSDSRSKAKVATANAEALEIDIQTRLAKERLITDLEAAQQKVLVAQRVMDSFSKRARLAKETRGFFDKSFRLGETDLPTRLRVELEVTEAERQVARARIDYAASVSVLRQALGLLPQ
jgi:outer membrane protein, heavy metal efflux system